MAKRDYYEVLGIARDATEAHIKSAYRKLARKYHPDVSKASDASAKFREATEAYEVLSDQQKRKAYDQFGHAGTAGFGGGQQGPGGARTHPWNSRGGVPFDIGDIFGGSGGFAGMSLDEILETLGGRMGGGQRGSRRASRGPAPRGQDLEYHLSHNLLQAVTGTTTSICIQQPSGQSETINVKIPPGVGEGSRVRVRGKGSSGPGGSGDLYIVVHIEEHPYFKRQDNDIYVELPISITEAAMGAKVDVPTLSGMMTVTIPPGTASGKKLRLKGKGVTTHNNITGDEYVVIKIVPPSDLPQQAAHLLREFDKAASFDPRKNAPWR